MKDFISFVEMKGLIDSVIQLCVTDEHYDPYMKEFAVDYCLLKYYDDEYNEEGINFENIYSDIYNRRYTDLMSLKKQPQVVDILTAIDSEINIHIQKEIKKNKIGDFLESLFDKLDNEETVDMIAKLIDDSGDYNGKPNEISE